MKLIKLKNVSISVVVPSLHKSKFMSKIFDVGTLAWKTYSELKWKPEWTSKNWKMIYLIAWPTTVARLKNFLCSIRYRSEVPFWKYTNVRLRTETDERDGDRAFLAFESERPIEGPSDRPRIPSQHRKTL